MAGIWNEFAGERKYVILTTEANAFMEGIHDRMPVILRREELKIWVRDNGDATKFCIVLLRRYRMRRYFSKKKQSPHPMHGHEPERLYCGNRRM